MATASTISIGLGPPGPVARVSIVSLATCPYLVTEADAAAIREAYEREGELSAAIELRRRFPGIQDNTKAREQARAIACWKSPPPRPAPIRRARKGKAP